jgi:hypothetical protein
VLSQIEEKDEEEHVATDYKRCPNPTCGLPVGIPDLYVGISYGGFPLIRLETFLALTIWFVVVVTNCELIPLFLNSP